MRNRSLAFYRAFSRLLPGSFVGKLLAVTLVGVGIPLICLLVYLWVATGFTAVSWESLTVVFVAVLIGAVLSTYALYLLITPLALSAKALHDYINDRRIPALPTEYKDLAGQLMSAVQHTIEHMDQSNQALEENAMRDFLTGAYNRRAGAERLQSDCARAERGEGELSLAFIDIDNLKQINDRYGHHFGDTCLKRLVDVIDTRLRKGDWIARWGGDEFVLLLWDVDMISAADVLLRLSRIFDEEILIAEPGEVTRLQISAGICQHRRGWNGDILLRCADRALYKAKASGKGGVVATDGNRYTQMR